MQFQQIDRSEAMAEAHTDPMVMAAAASFEGYPSRAMLLLMHSALYLRRPLTDDAVRYLLGQPPLLSSGELVAGKELARSCLAISNYTKPGRMRAAVFERVVEFLVASRPGVGTVTHEEAAQGLDRSVYKDGLSKPFDVVVKPSPFELYECKTTAIAGDGWNINQDDLTTFDRVSEVAAADSEATYAVLATMDSLIELQAALRGLTCETTVYAATREDLDQLAMTRPSVTAIAPS